MTDYCHCGAFWACEHRPAESEAAGMQSIAVAEAAAMTDRQLATGGRETSRTWTFAQRDFDAEARAEAGAEAVRKFMVDLTDAFRRFGHAVVTLLPVIARELDPPPDNRAARRQQRYHPRRKPDSYQHDIHRWRQG